MLSFFFKLTQFSIFTAVLTFSNCNTIVTLSSTTDSSLVDTTKESAREQLLKTIYEQRKITLIYPANIPDYQQIVEQVAANSRWLKINLLTADKVNSEQLKDNIFYLLGTPESNPWIQELLPDLPLKLTPENIYLADQIYKNKSTVSQLSVYPNPLNPKLPLSLMTANTDTDILNIIRQIEQSGRWRIFGGFGYEIYQNGRRVVMGNFNNEDWTVKPPAFDFTKSGETILTTEHFNFICESCDVDSIAIQQFARPLEANFTEMQAFLDLKKQANTASKINYHLYPTAEIKGLLTGSTERSSIDFSKKEVNTVLNEIYQEHEQGEENIYFLRERLGQPQIIALERGLAIHFTERWQRKGYRYWAVRLFTSDNLPSLKTILDNQKFAEGSDLVLHSSAATFINYLILEWGKEGFLQKYKDWQPTETEFAQLEKGWHSYLEKLVLNYQDKSKRHPPMPFCKGFNFAHEGYRIYDGYGSKLATQALEKLQDMGVNSVAIVPYSFQRDSKKPEPIPLIQHAGNENDEAIVHSAYVARKLGQTVLLKPQIWLGRSEWPGSIQMANQADWQQWMDYYHDWILHYAMLAEIHEMELFCLGVEFVKATTQNPEGWRQLIQQIRGIYSGYLTYAANWGDEFQNVNFWDDLDYIGLNSYYPLSKSQNPTKKELTAGFAEVEKEISKIVKKYNKPLLFTEIGFRSIEAPWQNPHAEANGANFNEIHQKMAYEVIYEATMDKDWCSGIYWWKFPTYIDYQGKGNTSFTPNNKAAEEVVRRYWRQ